MTTQEITTTSTNIEEINHAIEMETKRRIRNVPGSEKYGIDTACVIDGEFVLVSQYDVPFEMITDLENA